MIKIKKDGKFYQFFRGYRWWLIAAIVLISALVILGKYTPNPQDNEINPAEEIADENSFFAPSFEPESDDLLPFSEEMIIESPPMN